LNVFQKFNPAVQRNLLVLFGAGLLFWSGLAALLPTLPLYVKQTGATDQTVGIVMGAFAIGLISSRGWLARLADTRGRKIVLLIGMTAMALAPIGYMMTQSMPLLIPIRAFHGLSIAAFAIAYNALIVDLAPIQSRGEVISYMSLVTPIGMATGPAIGGFSQAWLGFTPMFLIAAGLGGVGLLCTAQVREQAPALLQTGSGVDRQPPQRFWRLLADPRIQIPATVLLLIGLSFGCLSTFVPLFIQDSGITLNVGLFYTAAAIGSFSMRLLVGPASDRFGRGIFISLSLLLYAISMLMLWQAHTATAFLLAGVIEGTGAGTLIPMIAALMADRSYADERGRTFGICMIGFDTGIALAGPLLGAVATQIGYRHLFGISAGLSFLGFLIFLTCANKDFSHSLRFALGMSADALAVNHLNRSSEFETNK
jgi:MFS family permease